MKFIPLFAALIFAAFPTFGAQGELKASECGNVSDKVMVCVATTEGYNHEYLVLRLPQFVVVAPVMNSESSTTSDDRAATVTRTAYYLAHQGHRIGTEAKIVLTIAPSEDGTKRMATLTVGDTVVNAEPFEMKAVTQEEESEETEDPETPEEDPEN